jgi:LacI family transcriptional regulator
MKRVRSRKGAPGIVEVAAHAGVSIATVSRSFNEPDMVREPTRKRIEQAAADLGYIRDRMAGTLHNRFSGTIGLVVPTIDNAIFAELIDAFSAQLQRHDRTMLIAAHGYDLSQEIAIVRSLLERRTDGIALIGFDHQEVPLNMLAQRDVPVISVWNYRENASIPCIGADNMEAGAMVTKHLLQLGHRDIAFLFPDASNNDRARDRLDGGLATARAYGLEPKADRVLKCPYNIGEAKALAVKVMSENPPTAIICGNDIIAHGVMFACQALNVPIPDSLSVVGIGDFRGSAHMEPGLTTVRLPARQIGTIAADTIIKMSETGMMPNPLGQKVELVLVERYSTKQAAKT